jgi:hypothetical protein
MSKLQRKSIGTVVIILVALGFTFQNCGPAKLNSSSTPAPTEQSGSANNPAAPSDPNTSPNPMPTATPPTASTPNPTPPPVVHIRTRVNNFSLLDTSDANIGSAVHLWQPASPNPNQDFIFTAAGEIRAYGRCLMPSGNTRGSTIVQANCSGEPIQMWAYDRATGIIRSANGHCVDLANSMVDNGTAISVWTCHGETNQQWDLIP